MDPRARDYVPISVKGMILAILVLVLLLVGQDNLLALVAGLAPLAFAGGSSRPERADEDDLDRLTERLHEVQVRAWRPLGAMAHIIDLEHPDRGVWASADVPMPLVARWPEKWPDRWRRRLTSMPSRGPEGLSTEYVDELVNGLHQDRRHVAVLGDEDTGKTSALLALFMQAQHTRDELDDEEGRRFPLPLRVSLAGWPEDEEESAGTTLLSWIVARLQEDYPGLLAHGTPLEALMTRLWDTTGPRGDRLMLFIDGIDTLEGDRQRALLHRLLRELRGRSAAIAVRTPTWSRLPLAERHGWAELVLAPQGDVNLVHYLRQEGTVDGEVFARRLVAYGSATQLVRRNPRLLQVLQEAYQDELPGWLPDPDARSGAPALTRADVMHGLWDDLLHKVDWPNRVSEDDARSSLRWAARQGLFASSRFAWWHVPGAAAQDPSLAPAYRRLQWFRAGSALKWALCTFAIGLLVLAWLLGIGVVSGYDRASHGLQASGSLKWVDVEQWPWGPGAGLLDTVVTNPVYLAALIALLVGFVVVVLARLGGEFEHEDGGRPQTIRLVLPRWRDLGSLTPTLHRRAVLVLLGTVVLAGVLQSAGVRLAAQLWAGSLFAALFVLVLAWLHWCADATDIFSPAGTFAGDQASTRAVALVLGITTLLVSAVLSWWFTSAGHVPTLQQSLWIVAAAATAAGLGRGFSLGAGMGAPLLLQVRPGFGIGYAARMRLLERALRAEATAGRRYECAPVALIGLLDLEQTWRREPGPDRIEVAMLLRPVGPLIRLRESNFGDYLRESAPQVIDLRDSAAVHDPQVIDPRAVPNPQVGRAVPGSPSRLVRPGPSRPGWLQPRRLLLPRSGVGVVALSAVAAVGLLTCTGMAAVVIPRLPCMQLGGFKVPSLLSNRPSSTVWLENGQCVGVAVPDGGDGDVFKARGVNTIYAAGQEDRRDQFIQQIGANNARIGSSGTTLTVLFLAPLTRTTKTGSINGLYQLKGAEEAQAAINASQTVNIRLAVANSAENFTSGPSVVQAVKRQFPRDDGNPWSISAVIGIAQSRTSAREALAQLGGRIPVVAASVNGTDMRHGRVDSEADLQQFISVSPDDVQVAQAMLDARVLDRARALLPNPSGPAEVRIISDPADTYFSGDLSSSLLQRGQPGVPGVTAARAAETLTETSPARRYRELAREMCAPEHAQDIWMFAGRGNQLVILDHDMPAGCRPVIVAGPGGISAVAASRVPGAELGHMDHLFFYTLTGGTYSASTPGQDTAIGIAEASDEATGYAALLEAASRNSPIIARDCPEPATGVYQLGLDVPPGEAGDGHNRLGPSSAGCGNRSGTPIYFCPFASTDGQGCADVPAPGMSVAPAKPAPRPVTAAARRGLNEPGQLAWYDEPETVLRGRVTRRDDGLPWDTRGMRVTCAAAGETRTDGWVEVSVPGHGEGFVHWKFRLRDQNDDLTFSVPGHPGFDPKKDLISDYVKARCRSTSAE